MKPFTTLCFTLVTRPGFEPRLAESEAVFYFLSIFETLAGRDFYYF